MKIAIVWEQHSWGGVDSHLVHLLSDWREPTDSFVILYNNGNTGFSRVKDVFSKYKFVSVREYRAKSFNQIMSNLSGTRLEYQKKAFVYVIQPILFLIDVYHKICLLKSIGNFDVLLSNNGAYPGAWGCLSSILAARYLRVESRLLLVHHSSSRAQVFFSWYESIIDKIIGKSVSGFICVSNATKNDLISKRGFDPEVVRFRVIYNTMRPKSREVGFTASPGHKSIISGLRQSKDEIFILIVGRIERYKGHEDIIFAVSRLEPEIRKRVRIAVIGTGDKSEIERLTRLAHRFDLVPNLYFLGYVDGDISEEIKGADMLVSATQSFEGFGLSVFEAMSLGVPVIATDVGAISEVVDLKLVKVIPPCSPGALALALKDYLTNKTLWIENAKINSRKLLAVDDSMVFEYRRVMLEWADKVS